jgi:rSAM/selenodomain-associated transferase 1
MRAWHRDAITPFIAATYGSRVPKSVRSAIVRIEHGNYTSAVFPIVPPPPQRLLVFARLPELGRVKTRLAQSVGDKRALEIYEAMLRDLLASIGSSSAGTEIEILWAPSENANGEMLARAFGDFPTAMQTGETLGDRLSMSFSERFIFHATEKIIAIGVDDPLLPRALIDQAFGLLDSCEWVIGPASDGGYYLIGCRAAAFDSDVFQDIEWGSSSVFTSTLARIRDWENCVAVLPMRHDIDVAEDLARYAVENTEGHLAALLVSLNGSDPRR